MRLATRTRGLLALLAMLALAAPISADDEKPEAYTNTLRWTTASEVDNFGFDVFRSESEDEPFERLNEDPIPGAGTTDTPTKYTYVDETINPDLAYYYYVESISMSGDRKRFTPIIHAEAKRKKE